MEWIFSFTNNIKENSLSYIEKVPNAYAFLYITNKLCKSNVYEDIFVKKKKLIFKGKPFKSFPLKKYYIGKPKILNESYIFKKLKTRKVYLNSIYSLNTTIRNINMFKQITYNRSSTFNGYIPSVTKIKLNINKKINTFRNIKFNKKYIYSGYENKLLYITKSILKKSYIPKNISITSNRYIKQCFLNTSYNVNLKKAPGFELDFISGSNKEIIKTYLIYNLNLNSNKKIDKAYLYLLYNLDSNNKHGIVQKYINLKRIYKKNLAICNDMYIYHRRPFKKFFVDYSDVLLTKAITRKIPLHNFNLYNYTTNNKEITPENSYITYNRVDSELFYSLDSLDAKKSVYNLGTIKAQYMYNTIYKNIYFPYNQINYKNFLRNTYINNTQLLFNVKYKDINSLKTKIFVNKNKHGNKISILYTNKKYTKRLKNIMYSKYYIQLTKRSKKIFLPDAYKKCIKHSKSIMLFYDGSNYIKKSHRTFVFEDNSGNNYNSKSKKLNNVDTIFKINKNKIIFAMFKELEHIANNKKYIELCNQIYGIKSRQAHINFNHIIYGIKQDKKRTNNMIKDLVNTYVCDNKLKLYSIDNTTIYKRKKKTKYDDTYIAKKIKYYLDKNKDFVRVKEQNKNVGINKDFCRTYVKPVNVMIYEAMLKFAGPTYKEVMIDEDGTFAYCDDDLIPERNILSGGTDELLLPQNDYKYFKNFKSKVFNSSNQIINYEKKIDEYTYIVKYPLEHPFKVYEGIAKLFVTLDVKLMTHVINKFYKIWKKNIFEFGTYNPVMAVAKMLDYLYLYILNKLPEELQYQGERILKFIRWYSEHIIIENCKYKIQVSYKSLKSELDKEECPIPNSMNNMQIDTDECSIINIDTTKKSSIEFMLHNPVETEITFSTINMGNANILIYINNQLVDNYTDKNKIVTLKLEKTINGIPNVVKIMHNNIENGIIKILNVIIKEYTLSNLNIDYEFNKTNGNKAISLIHNAIRITPEMYEYNKNLIKNVENNNIPISMLMLKLKEYMELHHINKEKGKRLTVFK